MSHTAAAHPRLRPRGGSHIPRRRSGPAPARHPGTPARQRTLADAIVAGLRRLGDARLLDRLVRGRAWIAIVALSLLGIVFMQVSLLRINASVGTAVTRADALDRENSAMRADIAELDSGERIQAVAAKLGMVMPPAGDVHFLDARSANVALAATSITPPKPAGQTTTTTAAPAPQPAPPQTSAAPAPVSQPTPVPQAPVSRPPAPVPAQSAPVTAQQAPAQPQPAPVTAAAGGATAPEGAR